MKRQPIWKGDLWLETLDALTARPVDLLDRLAGLPGAVRGDAGPPIHGAGSQTWTAEDGWTFVPGRNHPDNRVLLVAHVDTVAWNAPQPDEIWQRGGIVTRVHPKATKWYDLDDDGEQIVRYRYSDREPLGADDRAGVALTWCLRELGHSILWTDGEESGGHGAKAAARAIPDLLKQHAYMVQIDRAGDEVLALYEGSTSAEFEGWLSREFPAFEHYWGTFTDIAILGPVLGLCGVNLAAGYIYEHTENEVLFLDALENTARSLSRVLRKKQPPRFRPDIRDISSPRRNL